MKNMELKQMKTIIELGDKNISAMSILSGIINQISDLDILVLKKFNIIGENFFKFYSIVCELNQDKFHQSVILLRSYEIPVDYVAINLTLNNPISMIDDNSYKTTHTIMENDEDAWPEYFWSHSLLFQYKMDVIISNQAKGQNDISVMFAEDPMMGEEEPKRFR